MRSDLLTGYLALVLLLGSASCGQSFFDAEPQDTPVAIFEDLFTTFKESYGPAAERGVNWDSLYAVYRPQVSATSDDDALWHTITSMLATLDDGHVSLTAPGRPVFNANAIRNNDIGDDLFRLELVMAQYLDPGFSISSDTGYMHGRIRDTNIGYAFFDYVADNFFVFNDFLEANADTDGLIIDLRHNQGGDFTYSFSSMGRLTDQVRHVFSSRTKNGPGPDQFTAWYDWAFEPEGPYFNKPIVVLTDRYTISAGERAVMALMTLPNATFVGDTTSGAHSTAIGGELANGWYYSIATQNTRLFDGRSYEGVGLAPDIRAINDPGELDAGVDRVLETAIGLF
jgi:hypothetical protein